MSPLGLKIMTARRRRPSYCCSKIIMGYQTKLASCPSKKIINRLIAITRVHPMNVPALLPAPPIMSISHGQ